MDDERHSLLRPVGLDSVKRNFVILWVASIDPKIDTPVRLLALRLTRTVHGSARPGLLTIQK